MVADSLRKRVKHTRSKRGCTVCRVRKIRCDETRPACNKCTTTGRICEGFPELPLCKPQTSAPTQLIQPRNTTAESSAEERSFAYFRRNTSAQFAAPFGNEFWNCLVLQIGEREKCVKHAIVALGALHEAYTDEHLLPHLQSPLPPQLLHKPSWRLPNLATKSYSRALCELNRYISPNTYDGLHVSLLCCILFTSFEWLRGSYAAASTHLKSGLHILRQWSSTCTSTNTPTAHFIRRKLAPMFVRLSIQARTFSQDVTPMPWLCDGLFAPFGPDNCQSEEEHLHAARNALDALCGEVYLHPSRLKLLSTDLPHSAFDFSIRLTKWCTEYHKHLLPLPSLTHKAPRPENINLTLWYTTLSLLQATLWTNNPKAVDAYTPQFERIVHLCKLIVLSNSSASLLPREHKVSDKTSDAPRFCIDMEIVPMLYHVASKCRDPAIRRKAITLLRNSAGREGLWDGQAAARLAEEIVAIEEEGLEVTEACRAKSIPARQRVSKILEETDLQTRTTRVRFKKWGEEDYGEWRALTW